MPTHLKVPLYTAIFALLVVLAVPLLSVYLAAGIGYAVFFAQLLFNTEIMAVYAPEFIPYSYFRILAPTIVFLGFHLVPGAFWRDTNTLKENLPRIRNEHASIALSIGTSELTGSLRHPRPNGSQLLL